MFPAPGETSGNVPRLVETPERLADVAGGKDHRQAASVLQATDQGSGRLHDRLDLVNKLDCQRSRSCHALKLEGELLMLLSDVLRFLLSVFCFGAFDSSGR